MTILFAASYFKTFDMEVIQDRAFSMDFSTDMESVLLINEEAARQMNMTDPIGKHLGSSENEKIISRPSR
jgi:hypothetical protein